MLRFRVRLRTAFHRGPLPILRQRFLLLPVVGCPVQSVAWLGHHGVLDSLRCLRGRVRSDWAISVGRGTRGQTAVAATEVMVGDEPNFEKRRAEGLRLQARLPEGSNTQPDRRDEWGDVAVELANWGLVGLGIGVIALVLRSIFRRRTLR